MKHIWDYLLGVESPMPNFGNLPKWPASCTLIGNSLWAEPQNMGGNMAAKPKAQPSV